MKKGLFYLEKNKPLGCTFACLAIGETVHRFRISDKVIRFLDIKKDSIYDYTLKVEYESGDVDEECWEFKYLFYKMGIPADSLKALGEVVLV